MGKVITSRFPEQMVKKVDKAVSTGRFKSRSQALRVIVEEYLINHPELFLGQETEKLLAEVPELSDEEMEKLGAQLFKGVSVTQLVAEGRR